jgi:hypothetical protein
LDFSRIEAVGFDQAESSFREALNKAPFAPYVPGYVPEGLELERFNLSTFPADESALDLYYTIASTKIGEARPGLHVWQTNGAYEAGDPAQKPLDVGEIAVSGATWKLLLLPYPQPDGRVFEIHAAEGKLGNVSLSVDLRVGYDPTVAERQATLSELTRVLDSLAPAR